MRVDQHDLGQLRQHRVDRVHVQGAKARGELRLRLRGDRLVTEEQHLVLDQEFSQARHFRLRQLPGNVDPGDEGAEGAGDARDFDGHGSSFRLAVPRFSARSNGNFQRGHCTGGPVRAFIERVASGTATACATRGDPDVPES